MDPSYARAPRAGAPRGHRRSADLLAQRTRRRRSGAVPAWRPDELGRLGAIPRADRGPGARPARLRPLEQARRPRLLDPRLPAFPRALPRARRHGAIPPRRARLGCRGAGARAGGARAGGAPGGDERGPVPARVPLAPHRAGLADAAARRAGDGLDEPLAVVAALPRGERDPG